MIGELVVFMIAVFGISWLFGFWDYVGSQLDITANQALGLAVMSLLVIAFVTLVGCVLFYFIMAYCHKWFGPFIFGG